MTDKPPQIPDRFSSLRSLIPQSHQSDLEILSKRAVFALTAMLQLSTTSSASQFINAKMESITADLAENSEIRNALNTALRQKELANEHFNAAIKDLKKDTYGKERELIVLKRQEKTLANDMDEALSQYTTVQEAYSSIMMANIMAVSRKQQKKWYFEHSAVSKAALSFYGASRIISDDEDLETYCHLTGWLPERAVKCTHLVPKSLESDELSYLFGVREINLSEPRNRITLYSIIESGLNDGWIVIVPDKPIEGEETVWRCVLADQKCANYIIAPGMTWRDLDGKELKFLTQNRPARRYLYLRYVLTVLQQMKLNKVGWLDHLQSRGCLWAMPGPYLRNSMLRALARQVSDHFLPEVFYDSTFTIADGSPQRIPEDEEDLAMALDHMMQNSRVQKVRDEDESEDSD